MNIRSMKVVKTREYVWRVNITGAEHNWITCWHVVDADSGERIAGGHNSGTNFRSGYAEMPRKKDALAFVAGYEAVTKGCEFVAIGCTGIASLARGALNKHPALQRRGGGYDDDAVEWFLQGAATAAARREK